MKMDRIAKDKKMYEYRRERRLARQRLPELSGISVGF